MTESFYPFRQFSWLEMSALVGVLVVGAVFAALDIGHGLGPALLMVACIYAVARDWYGVTSLRGWIRWSELSGSARTWVIIGLVFFLLPYVFAIYFVRAIIQTVAFYQQRNVRAPLERKLRIAAMEAQLGMLPSTEGACRVCQRPLQAGAEFCHSCGAPVKERPQVCPKCAATTFPDAQWCPMCGTLLK